MKVQHVVKVEPVGEFELKEIRRPLARLTMWSEGVRLQHASKFCAKSWSSADSG
jgi:hypothetical protein